MLCILKTFTVLSSSIAYIAIGKMCGLHCFVDTFAWEKFYYVYFLEKKYSRVECFHSLLNSVTVNDNKTSIFILNEPFLTHKNAQIDVLYSHTSNLHNWEMATPYMTYDYAEFQLANLFQASFRIRCVTNENQQTSQYILCYHYY